MLIVQSLPAPFETVPAFTVGDLEREGDRIVGVVPANLYLRKYSSSVITSTNGESKAGFSRLSA